jgi:creatinine amidohydrolase
VASVSGRLENLSGPDVGDAIRPESLLIWPIGAVEQHGPHLPLSVDHVIADEVAAGVLDAAPADLDVWLLPTLSVSKSNEHAWSPGTLWLSATTLMAVIGDVARSVAATKARRLVFLNAHGGNSALLGVACREIRLEHRLLTFLTHPFVPPDQGGASAPSESGMGIHGGHDETSMMLYLRPELVDMDKATRQVPEQFADNTHVRFGGAVTFGWLSNDFGPAGHIGDPTGATAAHGQVLFEAAVAMLLEQLAEIARFGD